MSTTRPSLSRLFLIHQTINAREYPSLETLATLCAITERTLKRDLKLLRDEFGAPLAYSRERSGYWYTAPFSLSAPPLSEGELLALCLTLTLAPAMGQTPFAPALQRSLQKLRAMLPEPYQNVLVDDGPFISTLSEAMPPARVETAIHFNTLLQAIELHRQVRMTYYTMSRDAVTTRVMNPYHIYFRRGMWYLHGWCHLRAETRDFALERIQRLELLRESFTPPDRQAVLDTLSRRFSLMGETRAEVAIWFDADWARRIRERVWHASQTIEDHPDGACTLRMTIEGLDSVVRWILGFGRHARPLAPEGLVRRVGEEVRAMAAGLPREQR
jgi:predicted DNA-binding transcriptional regulator YafY